MNNINKYDLEQANKLLNQQNNLMKNVPDNYYKWDDAIKIISIWSAEQAEQDPIYAYNKINMSNILLAINIITIVLIYNFLPNLFVYGIGLILITLLFVLLSFKYMIKKAFKIALRNNNCKTIQEYKSVLHQQYTKKKEREDQFFSYLKKLKVDINKLDQKKLDHYRRKFNDKNNYPLFQDITY